jgi:hypothetical protein
MTLLWRKPRKDRIFINYRREDAAGFAGRLSDTLAAYFGPDRVFRDISGIDYGDDFEQVIDSKLAESGAVLVLIGDKWSLVTGRDGRRRLDDPGDYVLREISAALRGGVPVVPVLIGNAAMPRPEELPEGLRDLARRNAITVTDERWDFDVARLAKVLAIDVPGSLAQRKLDLARWLALALLLGSGAIVTLAFCAALGRGGGGDLIAAGYTPLLSALPFIGILLAGATILAAIPPMEESRRKFARAAVAVAALGTLAAFVRYTLSNEAEPSRSLVVNFAASTLIGFAMLALIALAGFRAK